MDKKELMIGIMEVCDENDRLKAENERLKNDKKEVANAYDTLDKMSKSILFDKLASYQIKDSDVFYEIVKDGKILTLSEWLNTLDWDMFYGKNTCPEVEALKAYSLKDVCIYFIDELDIIYNRKLDKLEKEQVK